MRLSVLTLGFLVVAGCTPEAPQDANGVGDPGKSQITTLEQHLQSEAVRLAANPSDIQQEDARWVASQLGEGQPERLKELLNLRRDAIDREYAERIRRDFPEFWDYPAHLASTLRGRNGIEDLTSVQKLAEALCEDARFKGHVSLSPDLVHMKAQLGIDLLAESEPISDAMASAASADHVTWVARRPANGQEMDLGTISLSVFKVVITRIHWLATSGKWVDAASEATALARVVSKSRLHSTLLGALLHGIVADQLVRHTLLPLAEAGKATAQALASWVECGRGLHVDVMLAFAIETADMTRLRAEPGSQRFNFFDNMQSNGTFVSVEQAFIEHRRYGEGAIAVLRHATGRQSAIHKPDGLRAGLALASGLPWLIQGNLRDVAEAHWVWAALEVRDQELAAQTVETRRMQMERALADWPALEGRWSGSTFELWARDSLGLKQDKPLIRLPALGK